MIDRFALLLAVGLFTACPSSSTPVAPDEGPTPTGETATPPAPAPETAPATDAGSAPAADPTPAPTGDAAETAANANNAFGLALYAQLREGEGNRFFSPISLSLALSMTTAGAAGDTERELRAALHLPASGADAAFAALRRGLAADRGADTVLSIANRLWGQASYSFLDGFLATTREHYGAELERVDFAAPEAARATINRWVGEQTGGRIPDLLPEGLLTDQTKLVLTNAVYFKGLWQAAFRLRDSDPAEFTVTADRKVEAQLMHRTGRYPYAEDDRVQVLAMPYAEAGISMVVVLPKASDGLAAVEAGLAEDLPGWVEALRPRRVDVRFPRFELRAQAAMKPALEALGVKQAFTLAADFSGMSGAKDLYLSAVVHEAYVKVDESGTEAAAATAAVVTTKSAEAAAGASFRADHPFFFALRDDRTGALLFLGRVVDPTAG